MEGPEGQIQEEEKRKEKKRKEISDDFMVGVVYVSVREGQ